MTPKKPSTFGPRGAWLAAALWGSASLSGAQAQAPDPGPIDTAEATPMPAYGVRPDPGPEPQPVADVNAYQGLWLSRPPSDAPLDPTAPTFQMSISGGRLLVRVAMSLQSGESCDIEFLSELPTGPTTRLVRVALTRRVINGAPLPDAEEAWVVTLGPAGVAEILRAGVAYVPGPVAIQPAYGLPSTDIIPYIADPNPRPIYGLPPSPDLKPKP